MVESNFVESLPPGWTMKERIRENGKRDKFYYAPKNGPIFNSRVEVYRYLCGNRIKKYRVKRKKKLALNQPWKIIAVEKVRAEIRVKQKDKILRRDSLADAVKKELFVVRRTQHQIDSGQSLAMNKPIVKKIPEKSIVIELPRRSKRLAGIEIDPIELKPKTRTCQNKDKHSDGKVVANHSNMVLLGEFLSDPCIAFAIKTLTGLTFDEIPPRRVNSEDENQGKIASS